MPRRAHNVTIVIGGVEIGGWTDYSIESSLLAPADSFTLTRTVDRRAWNVCELDALVQVQIDGVAILTGFVGELEADWRAGTMTVAGRCKGGRLVSESADAIQYGGLRLFELVRKLVDPWFSTVATSDLRNRDLRRGRGHKAPAAGEPLILDNVRGGRIEPGQVRWQVIEDLVTQAGYLCWPSADGREFVIALPNYTQEVQWLFRHADEATGTVIEGRQLESIEDAYSEIVCVGSGRGTDADYGAGPSDRVGVWRDGPGPFGVGLDFIRRKRLVLAGQSFKGRGSATETARREARRRNMKRRTVAVECVGHGQVVRGATPTIFAPNTIGRVVYDGTGLDAPYLVTSCRYQSRRDAGERTALELVPKGTELSL